MDITTIRNSAERTAAGRLAVRDSLAAAAPRIAHLDFKSITAANLSALFNLYDREFFDGWLGRTAAAQSGRPVGFRVSSRMTRAGGKTFMYHRRRKGQIEESFEIAVAATMLFMNFGQPGRAVSVGGLVCANRLEALQYIVEHEMIHLAELVTWRKSSCRRARFKALAANIFGHTSPHHALVTPREHAAQRHGVRVGSVVVFDIAGRRLVGRVNAIHQRATVLVPDPSGLRYSDGQRYAKFYVPLTGCVVQEGAETKT